MVLRCFGANGVFDAVGVSSATFCPAMVANNLDESGDYCNILSNNCGSKRGGNYMFRMEESVVVADYVAGIDDDFVVEFPWWLRVRTKATEATVVAVMMAVQTTSSCNT